MQKFDRVLIDPDELGAVDEFPVEFETDIGRESNAPDLVEVVRAGEIHSFQFNCSENKAFIPDPETATQGRIQFCSGSSISFKMHKCGIGKNKWSNPE